MRTISAMELRRRLGETLDKAAAGERIVVERDRRPLVVLVPYSEAASMGETSKERRDRLRRALRQLEDFGRRMQLNDPEGLDAAAAIRWERDHGHGGHG
jgi:prevent-host-death family protein